jgi:hypothetical protein
MLDLSISNTCLLSDIFYVQAIKPFSSPLPACPQSGSVVCHSLVPFVKNLSQINNRGIVFKAFSFTIYYNTPTMKKENRLSN